MTTKKQFPFWKQQKRKVNRWTLYHCFTRIDNNLREVMVTIGKKKYFFQYDPYSMVCMKSKDLSNLKCSNKWNDIQKAILKHSDGFKLAIPCRYRLYTLIASEVPKEDKYEPFIVQVAKEYYTLQLHVDDYRFFWNKSYSFILNELYHGDDVLNSIKCYNWRRENE